MRIHPVANRQPMVPRRAPELRRLMLLFCMTLAVTGALLPALPAAATPVSAPVVELDETFDVPEPVLTGEAVTD